MHGGRSVVYERYIDSSTPRLSLRRSLKQTSNDFSKTLDINTIIFKEKVGMGNAEYL